MLRVNLVKFCRKQKTPSKLCPTGFESYRVEDLLREKKRPAQFFICAGTVNSWPSCWVLWEEVEDFLREAGEMNELPSS